eukprot:4532696-Pyramimonas_sp.AAC.1
MEVPSLDEYHVCTVHSASISTWETELVDRLLYLSVVLYVLGTRVRWSCVALSATSGGGLEGIYRSSLDA